MRLELLVEEDTPQDVVNHLVTGIPEKIPPITTVTVDRYTLPRQRVYTHDELWDSVKRWLEQNYEGLNLLKGEARIITPEDADVMVTTWGRKRYYYNVAKQLTLYAENLGDSGILLMGTHHRSFNAMLGNDAELNKELWMVMTHEPWNDGYVLPGDIGAVAGLARTPTLGNLRIAVHELGHILGIEEHHKGCVMQGGNNYKQMSTFDFCDPCMNTIMRAA